MSWPLLLPRPRRHTRSNEVCVGKEAEQGRHVVRDRGIGAGQDGAGRGGAGVAGRTGVKGDRDRALP